MYPSCKIYQGDCSCKDDYISEMERNVVIQHQDSESAHHLKNHLNHGFNCSIIAYVSSNKRTRKNLEVINIAFKRPTLNDKIKYN